MHVNALRAHRSSAICLSLRVPNQTGSIGVASISSVSFNVSLTSFAQTAPTTIRGADEAERSVIPHCRAVDYADPPTLCSARGPCALAQSSGWELDTGSVLSTGVRTVKF